MAAILRARAAAWRATQDAISTLGPARAPADLALRLRVAISRERARHNSRLLDRLSLAWDNAVRPMLLQVTGGLVGSVALLGGTALLLGVAAAPQQVLANDEPLGALTAPHYLYSTASPGAIVTGHDSTIIVEASVDSRGRVYDYTIVSGPQDDAVPTRSPTSCWAASTSPPAPSASRCAAASWSPSPASPSTARRQSQDFFDAVYPPPGGVA